MKVAVLGGLGMQGKAALADLSESEAVNNIICADASLNEWETVTGFVNPDKVEPVQIDASSVSALVELLSRDIDVAIDLLPLSLMEKSL